MILFLTRNPLNHINNSNYFSFMLKIQSFIEMSSSYFHEKPRVHLHIKPILVFAYIKLYYISNKTRIKRLTNKEIAVKS